MTEPTRQDITYYTSLDGGVVWTEAGLIRTFAERAATVILEKEEVIDVVEWNALVLRLERRITEAVEEES